MPDVDVQDLKRIVEAEGEFTDRHLEQIRNSLSSARLQESRAWEDFGERTENVKRGTAQERIDLVERALADETFLAALRDLDQAREVLRIAEGAWRRCGSRRGRKLSARALSRRDERDAAVAKVSELAGVVRDEGRRLGVGISADRERMESALRWEVETLKTSLDVDEARERASRYGEEVAVLSAAEAEVANRLVSDRKLQHYYRWLGAKRLRLLFRFVSESYRPQPATIEKSQEIRDMAEVGLISIRGRTAEPSFLAFDVVAWVERNVSGVVPAGGEARLTLEALRESFPADQLDRLRANGEAALEAVRVDGPDRSVTIEVGIPEAGLSYKVYKTRSAVQRFLRAVGARPARANAKLIRVKTPSWTPGTWSRVKEGE